MCAAVSVAGYAPCLAATKALYRADLLGDDIPGQALPEKSPTLPAAILLPCGLKFISTCVAVAVCSARYLQVFATSLA